MPTRLTDLGLGLLLFRVLCQGRLDAFVVRHDAHVLTNANFRESLPKLLQHIILARSDITSHHVRLLCADLGPKNGLLPFEFDRVSM